MLGDLEQRLATVLGNALPAPFAGRVRVPPETASGAGPRVSVRVERSVPVAPDFGSVRSEAVLTPPERQRVVRLRCTIHIVIEPQQAGNRQQVVAGVDALVHLLDGPTFRTAAALVDDGDQGFRLSELALREARLDLRPSDDDPPHVTLEADGWFWPVGAEAEAGVEIAELRVRQVTLPLTGATPPARIPAGGDPVELRLTGDLRGTLGLRAGGAILRPFGPLAVRLLGAEGGPGAGSLSGGSPGPDGSRLVEVGGGEATVTYSPPATDAVDRIVVSLASGEGEEAVLGPEVARFTLTVVVGA